jgi:hypothetical protein
MITFSERARREDAEHFGLPPERVAKILPALDLDRYDLGGVQRYEDSLESGLKSRD